MESAGKPLRKLKVCVLLRLTPDMVEGIEIEDNEVVPFRYSPNERDEHAVEEALILKEKYGNVRVDVFGIADEDSESDLDEALAIVKAKGVDKIIKVILNRKTVKRLELAKAISKLFKSLEESYDIIFTGIQAIDAFSGYIGGMLASLLGYPYVGGVVEVKLNSDSKLTVKKELGGGIFAEYIVNIPAVVGVISAEKPLRFVPFVKLKQAMKEISKCEVVKLEVEECEGVEVVSYKELKPEISLIEGDVDEVAERLVEIFKEIGIL